MKLDAILSAAGKRKGRRRLGRGDGSGLGKTSGRGHKGYGARSGAKKRLGYEGGQTPCISRVPKRGFNNKNFRTLYQIVNVAALQERFDDGATVDAEALVAARVIDNTVQPVKILGNGELKKKLAVKAEKFSAAAQEKIEGAGGSVEVLDRSPAPVKRTIGKAATIVPPGEAPAESADGLAADSSDEDPSEE
ncbi:MAG: 50S ribosomal protein L15 [Planctomycetes bacterium]|jgi:large subunit ribosomal protein L15|nr:50S ribosomal protein L15 [Phycisphaerae bacterium]NBB96082.1 50S ribosomal protein L15 [Planctomycetota bacterium]